MVEIISGAIGTGNIGSSRKKIDMSQKHKKEMGRDMPIIPIKCMNPKKRKNVKTKN